jgi:hypothetical protein
MLLFQDSRFETVAWLIVRPPGINGFWPNIFLSFLKHLSDADGEAILGAHLRCK